MLTSLVKSNLKDLKVFESKFCQFSGY